MSILIIVVILLIIIVPAWILAAPKDVLVEEDKAVNVE